MYKRQAQLHPTLDLITVALAEASEAGLIEAPHIVACGHALSITGGHIDPAMFVSSAEGVLELGPEFGIADGVDEVVKATRYQIKHGAKVIKISATAGVMSLEGSVGAQQYTEAEMRARRWRGLRDRGYNERALKVLVERGSLQRKKLSTGGRPRVEYRWCV